MFVKNVKIYENEEKSLQKRQFADFFSKFTKKSLTRSDFAEFRQVFGACRCKNFEKFVFLSAELHRAAVDKCLQAFYIQLLINVHRARAPQLLTNSSTEYLSTYSIAL